MNILHKSSSLTGVIKYLITPVITLIFAYIIFLVATGQALGDDVVVAELPMMAWLVIVTLLTSWHFKNVEVGEDYLLVKGFQSGDVVNYRDIKWICQTYLGRPSLYIKYQTEPGKFKTIITVPKMFTRSQFTSVLFHPYQELEMTSFIRERLMKHQPDYNSKLEPSSWLIFGLMILSSLPFLAVSIFLLN